MVCNRSCGIFWDLRHYSLAAHSKQSFEAEDVSVAALAYLDMHGRCCITLDCGVKLALARQRTKLLL
jgi:hypothetical protein